MDFLTVKFILFFAIVCILNCICSIKLRSVLILISSLFFYYMSDAKYIFIILIISVIVYLFALFLEKYKTKVLLILGISCVLGTLLYFKYVYFTIDLINRILRPYGSTIKFDKNIIAPLGISFITFQALSYLLDVYLDKMKAEKNIILVLAFISFFPCVTSGPIQKARNFIPQLKKKLVLNYDKVKHGILLLVYGGLQKYYISDKLGVVINNMLPKIHSYKGFHYIFFAVVYAIYIYSNFNSYSDMAIGISEILGFDIAENFKRPYLSKSIKEFWRRWHISLNSWFVDYIYIPLGGSRKGKIRQYINIIIVFLLSGLWHGSSLHFVAWGLLNAIYQIVGDITHDFRKRIYGKLGIKQNTLIIRFIRRCVVFYLISISWIFFSVDSFRLAVNIAKQMLMPSVYTLFDEVILGQFSSLSVFISVIVAIILMVCIEITREKLSISKLINDEHCIIRIIIYVIALVLLIYGYFGTFRGYGNGGFIYGNF